MNTRELVVVALCVVACATTTVFAADDSGGRSASSAAVAAPANPKPGMVLSGYKGNKQAKKDWLQDSATTLPKAPAIKTVVDTSEVFSLKPLGATESNVGMWSGFYNCDKHPGVYTLTLTGKKTIHDGYSLRVNGKTVIAADKGQTSADVTFKAGWNKIDLVCQFSKGSLSIVYKPKESLSEARPFTPALLFHDQKPEADW